MAHARPFRFGIQATESLDGDKWAALARKVEDLGYSTLMLPDHFGDQLAPVPALAAAAAATTTLRVGPLVLDNDYRHPVVLAKEAATLDVLSGGRLELGLGAGWMNADYDQSGIVLDPADVRVNRMAEAVTVLKGLFAEETFSFSGQHYTITGLNGLPKPVQRPYPPLLIGGGSRKVLSIGAREADIVGINPSAATGVADGTTARSGVGVETDRKLDWVRQAAADRYATLELNMLTFAVIITEDRVAAIERLAPRFGLDPGEIDDFPHALFGTPRQISEQLQSARERWDISYWIVHTREVDSMAPIVASLTGT